MTRPVFFECLQSHALLWGNAYAEIVRTESGRPSALWPIHPTRVTPLRDTDTGNLKYQITAADGSLTFLSPDDIVHVPGLTWDGSVGYDLLQTARETIGFGLASQRYANGLYKNMSSPSGWLSVPLGIKMNEQGLANLARGWLAKTTGENSGGVPVLEQGITFNQANLSTNQQLQFAELSRFYVYEVARLLRIPPSKLQSLEKASFASLTEQNREFLNCINPWLTKWEHELEKKLLPASRDDLYLEFDTDWLTRADQNARYTAYQSALSAGWMSVNEVRAAEGLSNIGPDGDEFGTEAPTPPAPQPYPTVNPLEDANPTEEPNENPLSA